ncbi:hypothetical protein KI387_013989, partial [Taxus chinensis]
AGFIGPVSHSAGVGYGSARLANSSTGTNYYPAGPDTGTCIDSRADSGSSTSTGLSVGSGIGSHCT